jgi:hypothetical protein
MNGAMEGYFDAELSLNTFSVGGNINTSSRQMQIYYHLTSQIVWPQKVVTAALFCLPLDCAYRVSSCNPAILISEARG